MIKYNVIRSCLQDSCCSYRKKKIWSMPVRYCISYLTWLIKHLTWLIYVEGGFFSPSTGFKFEKDMTLSFQCVRTGWQMISWDLMCSETGKTPEENWKSRPWHEHTDDLYCTLKSNSAPSVCSWALRCWLADEVLLDNLVCALLTRFEWMFQCNLLMLNVLPYHTIYCNATRGERAQQ